MILHIDTTEFGRVEFVLDKGKKKNKKSFPVRPQESEKILEYLDKFLKKSKIKNPKSEIKKIVIHKGQGSFTGLRVAAAIAQALSLVWGVPVKVVKR